MEPASLTSAGAWSEKVSLSVRCQSSATSGVERSLMHDEPAINLARVSTRTRGHETESCTDGPPAVAQSRRDLGLRHEGRRMPPARTLPPLLQAVALRRLRWGDGR